MKLKRYELLTLLLILALAAGVRLTRLGLVEFKYDEATTARKALQIAREGHLPALGMISSLGPHNPPLTSYVLALPFAFSLDPRLASGWVALIGVAAVGLTYWVGRTSFGWRVGALAALLFAASPWAVFHSRKIWAQNLPALTLLFAAALLALTVRRKPWALTGALAAAAGLVSLHLGGLAFFVILALIALLFRRHVHPKPLLAGVALLLLILSPYLIYDARHGWPNLRGFANAAQASVDLASLRMSAFITGGYHLEDLAGERHADFVASITDLRWLDQVESALFWIGLAWLAWRVGREALSNKGRLSPQGTARLVLLCWWAVPVLLLLRHATPVGPHTLSLLYPMQHLTIAILAVDVITWGSQRWGQQAGRTLSVAVVLLALALVSWQVYIQQSLLTYVDAHDTPGGYGAPVKDTLAATREALALKDDLGDAEVIALLPGADPRYDGQAAVLDVLLWRNHRPVNGLQALVLPARPSVYLADPGAEPAKAMLAQMGAEEVSMLPLRTGSLASYGLFRRQPAAVIPPYRREGDPVRWASGVSLLGYDWSGDLQPGGTLRWTLYWQIEGIPPDVEELHWFNHLVGGEGARWGQMDGVGPLVPQWRVGDVVLTWFDIPISADAPSPPYYVRSGMYIYPEIVNISLLDATGNPAGEFVELGPIGAAP